VLAGNASLSLDVGAWSRWFVFNGKRWEPDETKRAFNLARQVCREVAAEAIECGKKRGQRIASVVSSAKTVFAVLTMAQSEPRIAATTDQWDVDPWLLNTPGGVVDLRNGEMREHRADYYLTKTTSIAPNPNCSTRRPPSLCVRSSQ
jgi:putative DNA primase/helicase